MPTAFSYGQVYALSHPIHPAIPCWAGDPPVEFTPVATLAQDGYYLRRFALGEHSATHMNAPSSFFDGGLGIEAYPPEALIVPAIAINVCAQAAGNPDYGLSEADVQAWEQQHGPIPQGCVVLLYTGWQARWPTPALFLNIDGAGVPHFPGFSPGVTQFLLAERAIAGVGIDTHGVDGGRDQTYATNRQVLAQRGIVLECLNHLDRLPPTGITLVIAPLALQGGSGSPATVFAFV